jgi:hypothetical protein
MTDWEKVKDTMTSTIILMIEEIPKGDGMETEINIIYPSRLNELLDDYNDIYELYSTITDFYTLTLEYHITSLKHLQIWIKNPPPNE